jgi:hypothetical protein
MEVAVTEIVLAPWQVTVALVMVHVPSAALQHAPAHGAVVHDVAALKTVVPVQPAEVLAAHAPVTMLQQVPTVQESGVQSAAAVKTEPAGQPAASVIVHARVAELQQAPAQGVAPHAVPLPW